MLALRADIAYGTETSRISGRSRVDAVPITAAQQLGAQPPWFVDLLSQTLRRDLARGRNPQFVGHTYQFRKGSSIHFLHDLTSVNLQGDLRNA